MSRMVFWEGHVVHSVHEQADGSLLIDLSEDPNKPASCGQCGWPCVLMHDRRWRRVRERDWFDGRVWLDVPVRRMDCHDCGAPVTERIAWLADHAKAVGLSGSPGPASADCHVVKLTGLHLHTMKEIDRLRLDARHGSSKDAACAAW